MLIFKPFIENFTHIEPLVRDAKEKKFINQDFAPWRLCVRKNGEKALQKGAWHLFAGYFDTGMK